MNQARWNYICKLLPLEQFVVFLSRRSRRSISNFHGHPIQKSSSSPIRIWRYGVLSSKKMPRVASTTRGIRMGVLFFSRSGRRIAPGLHIRSMDSIVCGPSRFIHSRPAKAQLSPTPGWMRSNHCSTTTESIFTSLVVIGPAWLNRKAWRVFLSGLRSRGISMP